MPCGANAHVSVYDLTAAGFWGPESVPEEIGWTEVPGVAVKTGMFMARLTGTAMEPLILHYVPLPSITCLDCCDAICHRARDTLDLLSEKSSSEA